MDLKDKHIAEKELWNKVRPAGEERLKLGQYYSHVVKNDTRFLLFSLSRYKFAVKMIGEEPKKKVLELGCNEGLGTLLLSENAETVMGVDFDEQSVAWANDNFKGNNLSFICDDFLGKHYGEFDSVVSLDVIEHISPENTGLFFDTITKNLTRHGVCLIGTPNAVASKYASEVNKEGHINLFTVKRLRKQLSEYFHNIFIFGMNDEVVHTGFFDMCHYIFAVACSKKC